MGKVVAQDGRGWNQSEAGVGCCPWQHGKGSGHGQNKLTAKESA